MSVFDRLFGDREPEAGCYEPDRRVMTDGSGRSGFARCGRCGDTFDDYGEAIKCCSETFDDGDDEDGGPPVALPDGGVVQERGRRADIASAGRGGVADQRPPACPYGTPGCQGFGSRGETCWQCFLDGDGGER